jgi:RNA polymerase sigma-54 factor
MKIRKHELQYRPELKQYLLPTLVYYLKLIELPNLELDTYVSHELETNPLLEEQQSETSEESTTEDEENESSEEEKDDFSDLNLELFSEEPSIDYGARELEFDPFDNIPAQGEKLYDVLMQQARDVFDSKDLELAEYIILNIEDDGFLALSPEEIAGADYELSDVERIIKKVQCFDPMGCAWRDTREPLIIQLRQLGFDENSLEQILVRKHLKDLQGNHPREIMKTLNINETRFHEAKEVIMKLDPKPGWRYSSTPLRYVNPDFNIRWHDNKLCANMNEELPPRIRVRREYLQILKNRANVPKEQLDFVRQKIQAAQNLIIAIEQRRKTLTRIIEGILDYQHEFFEKGYSYLKPITMTEFARQLSVNPSTISRALSNKYVESPQGIHQLKFFFTAAVGQIDKRIIFQKIKAIVDNEDKTSPLSDTQIAKRLSREEIIISRRTISKYRELLGIPAHQFRRQ